MLPSTKLRLFNVTYKAALKYGSEVCVLSKKKCQKLETAEMKVLRSLLGWVRLDHQSNETIREKLKVEHIAAEIQRYQENWLQHVKRMEHARTPRMALAYKPKGKRNIGRPKTRRRDQQHLQD
jgi:hypothetical protein